MIYILALAAGTGCVMYAYSRREKVIYPPSNDSKGVIVSATGNTSVMAIFRWSFALTGVSLVVAFLYGGWTALFLTLILGIMEVTLSFDNAVVNAKILERMDEWWQKIFLTVGIVIAVFGMRLVFPLLVVGITANLGPIEAFQLALEQRPVEDPTSYAALLERAYPQIAAFGGVFLMMLFFDWTFEERDIHWLSWLEKPLAKAGKLDVLSVAVTATLLVICSQTLAKNPEEVLVAGVLGIVTYIVVNGLGNIMEQYEQSAEEKFEQSAKSSPSGLVKATGKAGFFLFLYLEVLDASFSFDGVIGAFAITTDPIIIALGLGIIGAMYVRSLTVFLVRKGTLGDYVYLEHGAHWAIGALAVIMLIGIGHHVPEEITGLIGLVLIFAALGSSILRNRRLAAETASGDEASTGPIETIKV